MNQLHVGDRVRDIAWRKGMTGTVIEVIPHDPADPIQVHGFVTVRLDPEHVGKFPCSPVDEEHYVDFEWWKTLERIEGRALV